MPTVIVDSGTPIEESGKKTDMKRSHRQSGTKRSVGLGLLNSRPTFLPMNQNGGGLLVEGGMMLMTMFDFLIFIEVTGSVTTENDD